MSDEMRIGTTESVGELLRNKAPLPPAVPSVKWTYDLGTLGGTVPRTFGWFSERGGGDNRTSDDPSYRPLIDVLVGRVVIHADDLRRALGVPSDTPIEVLWCRPHCPQRG